MPDHGAPDLESLFETAVKIESAAERRSFLQTSCGDNVELRKQVDQLLASHEQAGSFLNLPPVELGATMMHDVSSLSRPDAPKSRSALTSDHDSEEVTGYAGHSMLTSMGQTIDLPRVVLREEANSGRDPIVRPNSPEMPARNADSRYRLTGEIARGGMGAILKGLDTDLGRDLAIKVLLDQHKDKPEVIQRFVEEAQIGGQLQHPGIVPVYELGQFADKRPFFSMKLVKGHTLSALLAERSDPSQDRTRLIGIFEQICQTMAYAHSRGVIHRDLKPANIMVGAFGEVQVMDWGLAKVLTVGGVADEKKAHHQHQQQGRSVIQTLRSQVGSDSPMAFGTHGSQTQMGSVMGTPAYMPPEQALGEIDNLDERADVFGLGAILCEILTGQPPYVADDGTRVFRMASRGKLDDCFQRLATCGASAELVALTKHCLALEPTDRPRDAGVLALRVTEYLESVEARLRDAEVQRASEAARADAQAAQAAAERQRAEAESERASEERKRRRVSVALAASVLLLVGLGSGGWLYLERQEANRQTAEADSQRRHASEMQALAEQREEQRQAAQLAQRRADDEKIRSLNMLADMQTERGMQAARDGQTATAALWFANAAKLTPHDPVRVRANSLRAASWTNESLTPAALLKLPEGDARQFAFQPNGSLLLTVSGTTLRVWDWRNEMALPWSNSLENVLDAAWSPDGKQLAIGFGTADVRIVDSLSGDARKQFQNSERVEIVEWSPDGSRLAVGNRRVQIWHVADQPVLESDWPHPNKVFGLRFNRAGTRLVTACEDELARVFAVGDAARPAPLYAPIEHAAYRKTSFFGSPVFCDEDRRLVTVVRDSRQPVLRDAETGLPVTPGWTKIGQAADRSLVVSPDGRWVAAAGFRSAFLLGTDGQTIELKHPNHVENAIFHPDGQSLTTACWDGTVRWWPRNTTTTSPPSFGTPITLPQLATTAVCVLSPDGASLAISSSRQLVIWERPQEESRVGQLAWVESQWKPRVSPDGRLVTPGALHEFSANLLPRGGSLLVARTADGQAAGPPLRLNGLLFDSCVCAGNRSVAAATVHGSIGLLTVYNIATGTTVIPSLTLPDLPISVAARPNHSEVAVLCRNGKLLVIGATDGLIRLDLSHEHWPGDRITSRTAYSPDGTMLVTVAPDNSVIVRDAQTGVPRFPALRPVLEGGPLRTIAFSRDSHLLATAVNGRNAVQVWDLQTGQKAGHEMPHPGDSYGLWSVDFSPDGEQLVTGHKDGRARIWDWKSGELIGAPMQHSDEVFRAEFTTDGRHILSAVRHGTLVAWDVATRKLAVPPIAKLLVPGTSADSLSVAGDRVIVAVGNQYSVVDLSLLLPKPPANLFALLTRAELATNQREQLGELVPLEQQEWSARWEQLVAARQTPDAAAESLAREWDSAPSETARRTVVARALHRNLGERLVALRARDPHLLSTVAAEWSRTGNEAALRRVLTQAIAAIEAELADRRQAESTTTRAADAPGTIRPPAAVAPPTAIATAADAAAREMIAPRPATAFSSEALQRQLAQLLVFDLPIPQWHTLIPTKAQAESNCSFATQADGSILVGARPVPTDRFTIAARSPVRRVTALKLEAIPDPRLPRGGSGYDVNGNFNLTGMKVQVRRTDGTTTALDFGLAASNYNRALDQNTTPADGPWGVIDDDRVTHWDVYPHVTKQRWLTLALQEPCELALEDELVVELEFRSIYHDSRLGRFALAVSQDERAAETLLFKEAIHRDLFAPHEALAVVSLLRGAPAQALERLTNQERVGIDGEQESAAPPTSTVTWLLRAKARQQLGESEAAKAIVEKMFASADLVVPRDLQGLFFELAKRFTGHSQVKLAGFLSSSTDELARLNRIVALSPENAANYGARGLYWTRGGRWSEAATDFERQRQLTPENPQAWFHEALVLLLAGDVPAYQTHCRAMLTTFAAEQRRDFLSIICRVALLAPDAADRSLIPTQRLRDSLMETTPEAKDHRALAYDQLAFAAYRDGQYEEALSLIAQSPNQTGAIGTQRLLIRAMSEEKLGRHEDAVKTLTLAEASIPLELCTLGTKTYRGPLPVAESIVHRDNLTNEILRREASLVIHKVERLRLTPAALQVECNRLASHGEWALAARTALQETATTPSDRITWNRAATLLVLAGDIDGYRDLCERMGKQFYPFPPSATPLQKAELVDSARKLGLLVPGPKVRTEPPVKALLDAVQQNATPLDYKPWFYGTLGLIAYRDGDFAQATLMCEKALEVGNLKRPISALAKVVLSMAQHQSNATDAAKTTLAEATQLIPSELATLGQKDFAGSLPVQTSLVSHDWLIAEILRREASLLIHHSERRPLDVNALREHGTKLFNEGRIDEAFPIFRQAIELDPKHGPTHYMIGQCYVRKQQIAEARAAFDTAIKVEPNHAPTLLAVALFRYLDSRFDDARTLVERSIALAPAAGAAHRLLGLIRLRQGAPQDALVSLNKALELVPQDSGAAAALAHAKRLLPLAEKFDEFLDGTREVADNKQRQDLAELCFYRRRYIAALRVFQIVIEKDPMLADNPLQGLRYNAACAAARAGNAEGDAASSDDEERSRFRGQAADWLSAELDSIKKRLADAPADERARLVMTLEHWRDDADLASLRDVDQIQKLPTDEQAPWNKFWSDFENLRKKSVANQPPN